MREFQFPARFSQRDENEIVVSFRDIPECLTGGRTMEECSELAHDALEEAIGGRITDRIGIPIPSKPIAGEKRIELSASMAVKASFYLALEELNFSNTEIALLLGIDEREVRRLLDPMHPSKLSRIERLLAKLGKRLSISMQNVESQSSLSDDLLTVSLTR